MTSPESSPASEDRPASPLDSNEIQQMLLETLCLEVRALTMAQMSGAIWPTSREEVEAKISAAHLRADWLIRGSYSGQEAPGPPA